MPVIEVDDHPVVRDGLSGILAAVEDFEVVGQASDGAQAVALARTLDPDDPPRHGYAKLGVSDRAAAVAAAFDRGLLTPGSSSRGGGRRMG